MAVLFLLTETIYYDTLIIVMTMERKIPDSVRLNDMIDLPTEMLADLNDWGINTVRDYCGEMGYSVTSLVLEEKRRIVSGDLTMREYLFTRRSGSHMRCSRRVRRAIFTYLVTNRMFGR